MLPSILRSQSRTFSVARPLLAKKSKETLPKEPKKKTVINEAGAKKNKVKIDEKLTKVESTHALIAEIETRKKTKELEISEEKTHFSQLNPKAMTVVDLKRELKLRGLKVSGLKAELTTRLKDALEVEAGEQTQPKAKIKATKEETKIIAELEAKKLEEKRKLEEEIASKELEQKEKQALIKAENEAKIKAKEEAKIIAELEAKRKRKLLEAAKELEQKEKAMEEALKKAENKARQKAKEDALRSAEEAVKLELEAKKKAAENAKKKAEEEARAKTEEIARIKAEENARKKAEEEAKKKAEEITKKKAEEEARKKAEENAKKKAEEEAKKKAEEEARMKAEEIETKTKEPKIEPIPLEQRSSFVQDAKMKDTATKEFIQDKQKSEKPKVNFQ